MSDYGIGAVATITADEADALIEAAAGFLERVRTLIEATECGGRKSRD